MAALNLEEADRVPYCEHGFSQKIAQKILQTDGRVSEQQICRTFGRANINFNFRPPTFVKKPPANREGREWYGDGLIKSRDDLKLMEFPDPYNDALYEPAAEFLKHKGEYAACAHVKLGIMPCWQSMGFETFAYALYDDLELVCEVLDRFANWSGVVIEKLVEMDFDFLWAFDDIAHKTGPIFSPKMFRELLLPRIKPVAEKITIPWIYHSDGNLMPIIEPWLSLGMSGMHPLEPGSMDIEQLKSDYGDRICLVGNINIDTLCLGTPDEVKEEVREKIRKLATGGGYIVSSSNSIPDYAEAENVLAMTEAIYEYGKY